MCLFSCIMQSLGRNYHVYVSFLWSQLFAAQTQKSKLQLEMMFAFILGITLQPVFFMHQRYKYINLASRCSDFKSYVSAGAPKQSQRESWALIFVFLQSPVVWLKLLLKVSLKLSVGFWPFFFFFKAIKGKVQVACCFESGRVAAHGESKLKTNWELLGLCMHTFALLQEP